MNKRILTILTVFTLVACNSPKEKALENIKAMEANDSIFTPKAIGDMKSAYLDFANKYPDDELAPEFIFKAAQRCNASADHEEAIRLFNSIIEKYPKSKMCEEALFIQGYIYENSMHDFVKAKSVYADFLKKYPNSDLAEDAKLAIENMGKSPEEIFESFKDKE
jgi:outer membrane protein assembly factor BamD (BamD/ComL family)